MDDEVEDQSDFLTEQAERVEPLRTPNQPVHSKPHLANEWLVTSKDHVFSLPSRRGYLAKINITQ